MSELAIIARVAPIATGADLSEPATVKHHEMFQQGALRAAPWHELTDIPILVDHLKDDDQIGHVTAIRSEDCWRVGTWVMVHATVADPPAWLRKGTPVSVGHSPYAVRTPWGGEWSHVQGSFLNEVSLLSPGTQPAHPHAAVVWVGKPATRKHATRKPVVLVRRNMGRILAVTDDHGHVTEFR